MGSPAGELEREGDEVQHRVTLDKGYYLGVHLVTQAQWKAVTGKDPSTFKGDVLPVENVSWHDCVKFCDDLGRKTGKKFRLPTEAEWEYACRAGTTTAFWWGDTISTDQANYDGRYTYGRGNKGVYRETPTPASHFDANPWGLHDMHGNLWEWCSDWYGPLDRAKCANPQGNSAGNARVLRGGSWDDIPRGCRAACRNGDGPAFAGDEYGCRVLLCLD